MPDGAIRFVGWILLRVIFEFIVEGIVHGLFHGLKRCWYFLTGQRAKSAQVLEQRQEALAKRRATVAQLRRRRLKKKKKKRKR